jgi:hypothetical protein
MAAPAERTIDLAGSEIFLDLIKYVESFPDIKESYRGGVTQKSLQTK